jgi:hypothetical protein
MRTEMADTLIKVLYNPVQIISENNFIILTIYKVEFLSIHEK